MELNPIEVQQDIKLKNRALMWEFDFKQQDQQNLKFAER